MPVLLINEALIRKHGGSEDQLSHRRGLDEFRLKALVKLLESKSLATKQRHLAVQELLRKCNICLLGAVKYGHEEQEKYYASLIDQYGGTASA